MPDPHPHAPDGELTRIFDDAWPQIYEDDPGPPAPEPNHDDGYGRRPARDVSYPAGWVPLKCPKCGGHSTVQETRFGRRDECKPCKLWSWKGKPLRNKRQHDRAKARYNEAKAAGKLDEYVAGEA